MMFRWERRWHKWIGSKENEITKTPAAVKLAKIDGKVVTEDAVHTQKRLAHYFEQKRRLCLASQRNQLNLYKNFQSLFAPDYPKLGFGKIPTDFLPVQTMNKGHGRIEKCTLTTSEMLYPYATWPGLVQAYRLERKFQW